MTETIYVPLENTAAPTQHAAQAFRTHDQKHIILKPAGPDPTLDSWKFPPGAIVECDLINHGNQKFLVAMRTAKTDPAPPAKISLPSLPDKYLHWKIHAATLILGAAYFVLTLLLVNGTLTTGTENLIKAIFGIYLTFLGAILLWLTYFVQLAILNTLSRKLPFLLNLLIAILVGPFVAFFILRTLLFFHTYLS